MQRKQERVLHFAGILLLSGVLAGQLAGIFRDGKMGRAIGNSMSGPAFVLADGPVPTPQGPPIRHAAPAAS